MPVHDKHEQFKGNLLEDHLEEVIQRSEWP